jgi:hypothetical protein
MLTTRGPVEIHTADEMPSQRDGDPSIYTPFCLSLDPIPLYFLMPTKQK